MIYVCRVDTGSRHIFDLANGIENVGSLASAIEKQFRIEKSKQILLVSGGEVLEDYQRKFYGFGFGCEESPIYLIDKTNVEKTQPPNIDMPLDNFNQDFKQELQAAIFLKPSFQTLQTRSQLAYKVNELDKNLLKLCQSFFDEQYWQYQGYLALIANLDDYVSSFRKKEQGIREQFVIYLSNLTNYKELIKDVDKYIGILSHVRLLPQLVPEGNEQSLDLDTTTSSNMNPLLMNKRLKFQRTLFSSFSSQSLTNLQSAQLISNISKQQLPSPNELNEFEQSATNTNDTTTTTATSPNTTNTTESTINLLDWIKSTDPQNRLSSVIDETKEILDNFEAKFKWSELEAKISKLLGQIESNQQMKEIEGLAKRLDDLKGFLGQSSKFLASQSEIAESLKSNFERASSLRDDSILQDLCKGHERQLEIFKSNHSNMIEIANKISRAKLELIRVVHSRLHWVMQVQKQIADYDFQLQICFKQLKRINVRVKLMDQLKKAPYVYLYSIKEAFRRLNFSKTYKQFGKAVLSLVQRVCANEMQQRQKFDANSVSAAFSNHFILNVLFRCLNDRVEPFLNENTFQFDNNLPLLDEEDVRLVENELGSYLKQINSNTSPSSSASFSNSSNSSTSSSSSTNLTTSSPLAAEKQSNNNYLQTMIKELNLFTQSISEDVAASKYDSDLLILSKLNDLLLLDADKLANLNFGSNEYKTQETKAIKTDESNEKSEEKPIKNEHLLMKNTISDLKSKLNETKQFVQSYQAEVNDYLSKLAECKINSISANPEKEVVKFDLEMPINEEQSNENKTQFDYSSLHSLFETFLKSPSTENINSSEEALRQQIDASITNESEKAFLNKLLEQVKQNQLVHTKEIEELKASMQTMKTNMNAEKQIWFNEAIKRVTKDKDKLIDEMRAKQDDCYERINQLELELKQYKENQSADTQSTLVSTTTITTNAASSTPINIDTAILSDDVNETKSKLRELMLQEKVVQLEKQLAQFSTLPLTNNFYENIQLNSCNVDDLVLAVYSDEYSSYKIIHKTSSYLHFVHSAIMKNYEQRLSFKAPESPSGASNILNKQFGAGLSTSPSCALISESSMTMTGGAGQQLSQINECQSLDSNLLLVQQKTDAFQNNMVSTSCLPSDLVSQLKDSPPATNENASSAENMFFSGDKQMPQWFVGKVILKEFCIARKENNRFKVPSGTRFYRVKLKPYNLS